MENKSMYRWETKEEQDEKWRSAEEYADKKYIDIMEFINGFGDKIYSKEYCETIACTECINMNNFIRKNRLDLARKMVDISLDIMDKTINESRELCYFRNMTDIYFFIDRKQCDKYFEKYIEKVNADINVVKAKKDGMCISYALDYMKYGDFEKAKEYIKAKYELKPKSRLNKDTVYHLERFCAFVAEYLSDAEKNADMLPKLTECFKFLFDEDQKGSKKLYSDKGFEAYKKDYVTALRYIWYKYFSGRNWTEIDSIEVLQSERYGVKGLQDC